MVEMGFKVAAALFWWLSSSTMLGAVLLVMSLS
jgi:hypothetical protein